MILHIMNQAKDVESHVATALANSRTKVLTVCHKGFPIIAQFPVVIQMLLVPEIWAVAERSAAGKPVPYDLEQQDLRCKCKFSRSYLLPCRHIFHLHKMVPVLTPIRWQSYLDMFEEGGLEVYETMAAVVVEEPVVSPPQDKVESLLELREIQEQLEHQMYAVHDLWDARMAPCEERRERVKSWLAHVRITVASLINLPPEDIANKNRPWEL